MSQIPFGNGTTGAPSVGDGVRARGWLAGDLRRQDSDPVERIVPDESNVMSMPSNSRPYE